MLGKHSGRHALAERYRELGVALAGAELNAVYTRFTRLADRKKRIYDQDLFSLLPSQQQQQLSPREPLAAGANHAVELQLTGS